MAIYSFLLTLALIAGSPWWLWRMAVSNRYREGLAQRLGFVTASFRAKPRATPAGKQTIWVHAVSVGEVLAVERLIAELRTALPDFVIAVSTTTATGHKLAHERFAGSPVFYFPLDFSFAVRSWLRVLRPSLMVLVESEFWPRHLAECTRAGIPVVVVNARISDRSFPRYMRLRRLWKPLLAKITLFLAQGEESAHRLRRIGAPAERVQVSGNLKYDAPRGAENAADNVPDNVITRSIGSLLSDCRLLVAGSTHEGEEQALLAAWPAVCRAVPGVALLIAPRHPQRFDEVERTIRATQIPFFRCSALMLTTEPISAGTVLLLDTIGDLNAIYGIATAAFVGGSLIPRGGQNPLEPARFGIPVVMGPSYENFREIVEKMKLDGTLYLTDLPGLADALIAALQQPPRPHAHMAAQTGATQATVEALTAIVRRQV